MKKFFGTVLFGAIFMVVGALIVLLSADIIPSSDANFNAPRWVVALMGMLFMVAGTLPMFQGLNALMPEDSPWLRLVNNWMFCVFLFFFAVPFNWVAFASGEAGIGFIVFALFIDFLFLFSLFRIIRGDDLTKSKQ